MSIIHFGSDLGMSSEKIVNKDNSIEFIAQVSTSNDSKLGSMSGLGTSGSSLKITLPTGNEFFVGKGSHDIGRPVETYSMDRFTGSPEMIALFYGAFTRYIQKYGEIRDPVEIICGLPIEYLSGDEMKKNVQAIKNWMTTEHLWEANNKKYYLNVEEVRITSQPGGAFFDYVLDMDGKIIPNRQVVYTREIGVISVGMNTTELLVIRDRRVVERFSSGFTSGVRRLLELVNPKNLYSIGELDSLLRSGNLDISQSLPVWQREIIGDIERRWGSSWKRFEVVLLVGGGVILLKNTLPYFFQGKAFIPDDPVMSIARGLYKLGLYQNKPKNE